MKIVLFGCRSITVDIIKYLRNKYDISMVIHHDEDRDRIYGDTLVSEYCKEYDIPNTRFDKDIDADIIANCKPDIILSSYYRKILRKDILSIPKLGCINVHSAILPSGRGPAPTMWNVLNGDHFAGATLHYMDEGIDSGDIIDQKIVRVNKRTGFELNRDLMQTCYELVVGNIDSISNGTNKRIPQNHDDAEYCLPFKKSLRYLVWNNPETILNAIRAFTKPYDGAIAYTSKNEKVMMWRAEKLSKRNSLNPPGWFDKTNDGLLVQTNTTPILVTDYTVVSDSLRESGRFISGPPVLE